MEDFLKGWGDTAQAGIIGGELVIKPKLLEQLRTLTLDEIFNNGGKFREQ